MWIEIHTIDELDRLCSDPTLAIIFDIIYEGIRLRDMMTWNPYLSHSRCQTGSKYSLDNGKLISADRCRVAMTEIDYHIVKDQYDYDRCAILRCMVCKKKPLPKWFLDTMREWYTDKVQLKYPDHDETPVEKEIRLRRLRESKSSLNAIYGMCATAWARDKYSYDFEAQDWALPECKTDLAGISDEIDKIRKPSSKTFLPYAWGIYTTAYARQRLFRAAECCHALYCDTDSVKGIDWDMDKLEVFNAELRAKSDAAGFTIKDAKGVDRHIGVFEQDVSYVRFSALHAKCYAGEVINSKSGEIELHATIAGVTDTNGYPLDDPRRITKEDELGSLEELEDGKIFTACGGTRAIYKSEIHDIIIDGERIHSYGGCAILNTTYEIGGTNDLVAMYLLSDPYVRYK